MNLEPVVSPLYLKTHTHTNTGTICHCEHLSDWPLLCSCVCVLPDLSRKQHSNN